MLATCSPLEEVLDEDELQGLREGYQSGYHKTDRWGRPVLIDRIGGILSYFSGLIVFLCGRLLLNMNGLWSSSRLPAGWPYRMT